MTRFRQTWRRLGRGPTGRSLGDLFPAHAAAPAPTVVLVHGGFWKWPYNRATMLLLARDARRRGWSVANLRYRRVGRWGGGGGWPTTFDDVRAAMRALGDHRDVVDVERVVLVGHSAGAQLALWVAGEPAVEVAGVVSLAGVTNLEPGWNRSSPAVRRFLDGTPDVGRFTLTSPRQRLPVRTRVLCVHGSEDRTVRPRMSKDFVEAARAAGDDATYVEVDGEGHRDALLPRSGIWRVAGSTIAQWVEAAGDR